MTARLAALLVAAAVAGVVAPAASAAPATTIRVSLATGGTQANADSPAAVISADGNVVAFDSDATNLSRRPDTNHAKDVFARDLRTGVTRRVSVSSTGAQARGTSHVIAISRDGNLVLFASTAANLVPATATASPTCSCATSPARRRAGSTWGRAGSSPRACSPSSPAAVPRRGWT